MPGVLIIEAMAQTAGAICIKSQGDDKPSLVYFMTIDNAKFRRPVVPGDRLRHPCEEVEEARQYLAFRLRSHGRRRKGCGSGDFGDDVAAHGLTSENSCRLKPSFIHRPSSKPGAQLGVGVHIGPFCHVGSDVVIGDGTTLISHVTVSGATTIGAGLHRSPPGRSGRPAAEQQPQGRAHHAHHRQQLHHPRIRDDESSARTMPRRHHHRRQRHISSPMRMSRMTASIGNNVTMTNGATLGGHCEIGDNVGIGGLSAVHQFVRVGHNAFVAGGSMIVGDVIPYGMAMGNRAKLRGLNIVGLRRSGMSKRRS